MKSIVTTWGVHPANIVPIYSALFPLPVDQARNEIRKSLGYKGTVVISAGRLVPWKGFMTLIEILPELRKKIKDANLVIIGEGPDDARLKARVHELGVSEHVRFVPRQAKHALGAAIVGADVFVLNTSYEGLSHQLLEVMALGVPIVTTNVGGNPELIKDTVTGILVPYDDKEELISGLERASTHEDFRESLVRNARLRVKDFEKEKVIKDLVNLLEASS
jgi:glycosyltransferase involved in cell wall biosynthesis